MRKVYKIAFLTLPAIFIGFEIGIRLLFNFMPIRYANAIYNKYHTGPDGIYYYNKELGINLMKPNFKTRLFWNGYFWEHATDSLGFRNPHDTPQADIVILGDSLVYGQGVNEEQTLCHFLRENTKLEIVNLGISGLSPYEEYIIFREFGIALHPKIVIIVFYENDINDLLKSLDKEEMEYIINTPLPVDITFSSKERANLKRGFRKTRLFLMLRNIKNNLLFLKLSHFLYLDIIRYITYKKRSIVFGNHQLQETRENMQWLAWECFKKLYLKLNYLCKRNNCELIVALVTTREDLIEKLNQFFLKEGISFIDPREALGEIFYGKDESKYQDFILKHDGHLSELGNKKAAQIIEDYLKERNLL